MDSHLAVAFRYASAGDRWDRIVAAATGSLFSHCELVFGPETGAEWHLPPDPEAPWRDGMPCLNPVCFSASPADGGTRFKRIDVEEKTRAGSPAWKIVPLPMIDLPAASRVVAWCADNAGLRYDWPGVLSLGLASVTLRTAEVPQWWFCSEVCFRALQLVLFPGIEAPARVTPQRLYDFCISAAGLWNVNGWRPAR